MPLTNEDLQQVGEYVKAHLDEWAPDRLLRLGERLANIEGELKSQRELMATRFEAVDERFETLQLHMGERFEAVQKQVDEQFASVIREMTERHEGLQKHMTERHEGLQKHMDERFGGLQKQMDQRFEAAQTKTDQRFADVLEHMDRRFTAVENSLAEHSRHVSWGFAALTIVLGLIGVVFTAPVLFG